MTVGPDLFAVSPLRSTGGDQPWLGQVVTYTAGDTTARVDVYGKTVVASVPVAVKGMQVGDQVMGVWSGGSVQIVANNTRRDPPTYTAAPGATVRRSMPTSVPAAVAGTALLNNNANIATNMGLPPNLSLPTNWNGTLTNDNALGAYCATLRQAIITLATQVATIRDSHNDVVGRTNTIHTATNAGVAVIGEVRSYADTATADLAAQEITAR